MGHDKRLRVGMAAGGGRWLRLLLPWGNAGGAGVSPLCSVVLVMIVTVVTSAQDATAPAAGATAALQAPLLDSSHVMLLHQWVERWTQRGTAEAREEDQAQLTGGLPPALPVSGCIGLKVTLRRHGITLGSGEVTLPVVDGDADAEAPPAHDLVTLARQATDAALREADQALADAHLKAVIAPPVYVPGSKTPVVERTTLTEIGPTICVDLQIAHSPVAITIGRTEEYHAIFRSFAPGYHGLILRRADAGPDDKAGWVWPASALASNINPRSQIVQQLSDLRLPSDALITVARPGGPVLHRFDVHHYVRPTIDRPPLFLIRGLIPRPAISLSQRAVEDLAAKIARHLERRIGTTGLVAGTYEPTSDTYNPPHAPDNERALALYALMRHTDRLPDAAVEGSATWLLSRRLAELARDLAGPLAQPDVQPDPGAISLTLLTLLQTRATLDAKPQRDALAARLMAMRDDQGYFAYRWLDRAITPKHPEQSLMAAALVGMYVQTRQRDFLDAANHNLAALWTTQQQQTQITSLPWLLMTELTLIELGEDRAAGDDAARAAKFDYLGDLIDRLCRRQIVETPELGPDDVVGGFDLTSTVPQTLPVPDWRSAFVLSFVAEALRRPQLMQTADRDRWGWLLTCGLTARFLALLTVEPGSAYYVRSLPDAVGGVQLTFWDNRLPAASSAMSLLALTQFQEALAAAQAAASPTPPTPPDVP